MEKPSKSAYTKISLQKDTGNVLEGKVYIDIEVAKDLTREERDLIAEASERFFDQAGEIFNSKNQEDSQKKKKCHFAKSYNLSSIRGVRVFVLCPNGRSRRIK